MTLYSMFLTIPRGNRSMWKIFIALFLMSVLTFGCRTVPRDDFSDEEYVWEHWSVSTNRIENIEVLLR